MGEPDGNALNAAESSETCCDQFRFAGVHPDGGSRLCECGLKYDEHRPHAQAMESNAASRRAASDEPCACDRYPYCGCGRAAPTESLGREATGAKPDVGAVGDKSSRSAVPAFSTDASHAASTSEKLVRDIYTYLPHRVAEPGERYGLLAAKFDEEVAEVKAAAIGTPEFAEELGDLVEVCYALGGEQRVEQARLAKRAERGGFDLGLVMRLADRTEPPGTTAGLVPDMSHPAVTPKTEFGI